jgi:hypothetical protein
LVFVAGLATGRLTPAPGAPDAPPDIVAGGAAAAAAIEPPETLEARATEASAEERPALLRRAGDLFVQRGDVAEALRCYRDHLASLPPQQVGRPAPEDSWLLAALKHAQD